MSEADEQITVIEYCDWKHIPVYHVPNGGTRNVKEAANLKRQGVKAGVPDLCIPMPKGKYHSLYIEMKYGHNKTSKHQDEWISYLKAHGFVAEVCYSADEAIKVIDAYLNL